MSDASASRRLASGRRVGAVSQRAVQTRRLRAKQSRSVQCPPTDQAMTSLAVKPAFTFNFEAPMKLEFPRAKETMKDGELTQEKPMESAEKQPLR